MKFLTFFILVIFSLNSIFARAGDDFDDYSYFGDYDFDYDSDYYDNSSTSSSCDWFFCSILWLFLLFGFFTLVFYVNINNQKTKNKLWKPLNKEELEFWNDEKIQNYISEIFVKVQYSWQNRDISLIEKFLTKNYFSKFSSQLSKMIKNNEKNIVDNINILQIKIISGSVKNGNFSAEISWTLVDYIVINNNPDSSSNFESEKFVDIWNFVFEENIWKVNSIKKIS